MEDGVNLVPPRKILVVDDEPDLEVLMRQRFRRAIRAGELDFVFAHNGLEALDKLRENREISVVLTDINMPQMDGLTLLSEIETLHKQDNYDAKAVVVSAYGDMENIRTAMNRGAFDFLTKPIDFQDVEITIGKTLSYVEQIKESRRAEEYRLAKTVAESNYEQLQKLEQLRDSLTHMIVHDLRTPLTSFLAGLQTIEYLGTLTDDQRECLELSINGGETLLGMINDLLDVSKMESGSLTLDRDQIDVSQLAARAMQQVASLAQHKDISLLSHISSDLPPLTGDEDKLVRTLVNLMGNAVKFTPTNGTITLSVNYETRPERTDSFVFSVSDSGEGIPPESFERIFEKFGQVENRQSGRKMSTGLGLTFCKMVVEAHGGRIWIESEIGRGSDFAFAIPTNPIHN